MANAKTLNVVNWVGASLSILVFAARAWARLRIVKSVGLDDLFMLISLLASIAAAGMITAAVHYGMGTHEEASSRASKLSFLSGIPVLIAQATGRISFAFTLLSVMGTTRIRQWFLFFMIAFQFIWLVAVLALSYGLCPGYPLSVFWDPNLTQSQKCLGRYHTVVVESWNYFQTSWDALSDFALALFPALILNSLNIRTRLKVGLMTLMGLGILCAMSLPRVMELVLTDYTHRAGICAIVKAIEFGTLFKSTKDENYAQVIIFIWTVVQEYIVIIAASVPSCRPLFRSKEARQAAYDAAGHGHIEIRSWRPTRWDGEPSSKDQNVKPRFWARNRATTGNKTGMDSANIADKDNHDGPQLLNVGSISMDNGFTEIELKPV